MNIEQIKEEYAKEKDYKDYLTLVSESTDCEVSKDVSVLMQRAFNAALELAAEKAEIKKMDLNKWLNIDKLPEHPYEVDKEFILSLKINS